MGTIREIYAQGVPTIGKAYTDGLAKGISSGNSSVINAAVAAAKNALAAAKKALGIASPSKEMAKLGGFTIDGFVLGLKNGAQDVKRAMGKVLELPDMSSSRALVAATAGMIRTPMGAGRAPAPAHAETAAQPVGDYYDMRVVHIAHIDELADPLDERANKRHRERKV